MKVNGEVIDKLGYKIKPGDKVTYGDESVKGERKVYMLLNKPKDYITTMDDPQERKTVIDLVRGACNERLRPRFHHGWGAAPKCRRKWWMRQGLNL